MNLGILGTLFSQGGPSENGVSSGHSAVAEPPSTDDVDLSANGEHASRDSREDDAPPPWLGARYEFHRNYADLYRGKRSWKVACFVALGVAALALAGLIGRVMTSEITPYVIERDRLGQVRYAGPVPAAPETPDQALLEAELTALVRDLRTVSTDPAIQTTLIEEAFVHVRGEAGAYLDDFFSQEGENPRALGRKLRRSVRIHSVIKVPGGTTYKIEWTETTRPARGGQTAPERQAWEAYLSVEQRDPETLEAARRNPLGLYVTDIEWTRVSGASEPASAGAKRSSQDPSASDDAPSPQ